MGKQRKFERDLAPWDKALARMNYKDLKRAVVLKGMKPKEVVRGDHNTLASWFIRNFHEEEVLENLDVFDDWVEKKLRKRGQEELIHPALRLGFIGERDEEGEVIKTKRIKGIVRKPKKKASKNQKFGIRKGTKKELTYKCQDEGLSIKKTLKKVLKEFPDANTKSVEIWYKRAARANKVTP